MALFINNQEEERERGVQESSKTVLNCLNRDYLSHNYYARCKIMTQKIK